MVEVRDSTAAPRVCRLGTVAAWVSAVSCLPYLTLKLAWTLDIPLGVSRAQLHSSGWVAGNAVMAVVQLAAVILVLALVRPWGERLPRWLLLLPVWVGTGLLFQVIVGSALTAVSATASRDSGIETGGIEPWVYVLVYSSFAVQGAGLAIAFACHVRARWGRLLDECSAVALRPATTPSGHRAEALRLVAWPAIAIAVICLYWAFGGSLGLPDTREDDLFGMQAARAAGALVAAAGLLGLAGTWGSRARFWWPVALTWLGSGAMVAFDGLVLVVNRVFTMTGSAVPEEWAPIDTVLVVKVVVGLAAAVLGAVVFRAASRAEGARTNLTVGG